MFVRNAYVVFVVAVLGAFSLLVKTEIAPLLSRRTVVTVEETEKPKNLEYGMTEKALILCCEELERISFEYGQPVVIWRHENLSDAEVDRCKAASKSDDVNVVEGPLWELLAKFEARERLVIVETDIRGPSSTYVVNVALPLNVAVRFVEVVTMPRSASTTEDAPRVAAQLAEHKRFKTRILPQLRKRNLIPAGFGYHPERMAARWNAMHRSLASKSLPRGQDLRCVDWGSNAGFFSVQLAKTLAPTGVVVVGVEGEAVAEYRNARKTHLEMAQKEGVEKNTAICNAQVHGPEFEQIAERWQFDVQLSLSVFHWFDASDHQDFLSKLGFHLASSSSTFLELPEARVYLDGTGQSMSDKLNVWYNGVVSEEELVVRACAKVSISCTTTFLGRMFHDTGTVRTLLRVDVARTKPPVDVEAFQKLIACGVL